MVPASLQGVGGKPRMGGLPRVGGPVSAESPVYWIPVPGQTICLRTPRGSILVPGRADRREPAEAGDNLHT
jgi:hypothetical protein